MMTAQELKDYFRTTLVAQRTIAQEFLALDALVDFANQNDNTSIPDWTGALTFQLDGSDDGAFCTEPDTNGRIRFFKTKVNNNTNNTPPTDPLITENAYWIEVSPGDGSAVKEWAAGVYGEGLIIVYFDTSGTGADPDLYVLAEATRPFHSTNFTTELAAGKWKRMQTVFDVAATGGTDVMNIGTTNADVINIGRVGATVNIYGNTIYSQVTNLEVSDKLIRLNRGGAAASAGGSGFELEENAVVTGYIKTSSDRNGYELKAPNQAGIVTLEFNASGDLIIKPAGTTKLTVSSTGAAVAGNVSNTGALFFSGAVSPAQITGNQNDYNPTDFHNYANVRLSSDASRNITGFSAPVAGEFKVVHNVGSFDIVFKNSDAGSAATNRFSLNADITLKANQSTIFWYDAVSSRWRAIQPGGGGSGWNITGTTTLTGAVTVVGTTSNTIKYNFDNLTTTLTNGAGLWLENSTLATVGTQGQYSPALVLQGSGWKQNATAVAQDHKWAIQNRPNGNTTNSESKLSFLSAFDGGAYVELLSILRDRFASTTLTVGSGGSGSIVAQALSGLFSLLITKTNDANSTTALAISSTYGTASGKTIDLTGGLFTASSGSTTYRALHVSGTINQSGTASGLLTLFDNSPVLTSIIADKLIGYDWNPSGAGASTAHAAFRAVVGRTLLAPAVTGYASLNVPNGSAPSSPGNGDFWTTANGLFFRNASNTWDISKLSYRGISSGRTLDNTDELVNITSGTLTVTLPTAVGFTGKYIVKNSGSGVVTINTTSSQTIDGMASGALQLNQYEAYTFRSDGSNWIIV